jgi:hypothetical protein
MTFCPIFYYVYNIELTGQLHKFYINSFEFQKIRSNHTKSTTIIQFLYCQNNVFFAENNDDAKIRHSLWFKKMFYPRQGISERQQAGFKELLF